MRTAPMWDELPGPDLAGFDHRVGGGNTNETRFPHHPAGADVAPG